MAEFGIFILSGRVQVSVPDNFVTNRDTNGYIKMNHLQVKIRKNKRESLPLSFLPLKFDRKLRKESNPHLQLNFL
jgi:hypothetical protein